MPDTPVHTDETPTPPTATSGVQLRARRESVPLEPELFTRDQRHAAAQAILLIESIARGRTRAGSAAPRRGLAQILPVIDETRLNHNVLIDGGRGSGKTSVLLSVLKYWSYKALGGGAAARDYVARFDTAIGERATGDEQEPSAVSGAERTAPPPDLESRETLILPMSIIDLQPLAPSTDLRLFLASNFKRLMDAVAPPLADRPRWAPDAAQWSSPAGTDVREAWTAFRDAVASGSDHVATRRARLDAVTYAVELEQAESSRQIAGAFGIFMDALREAFLRSELTQNGRYRPLFVLPIDDADMNPRLGAELVETINLLSHDDVVYLLTGDTELFLLLLREHLAGGFRHSLRSVDLENDDTSNIGDLIHLRSLAHQLYDKHIPQAHRCRIDPLPGSKRVELLADLLRRVWGDFEPLPAESSRPSVHRTLAHYFDLFEPRGRGVSRTGATERFTDGALPETMRGRYDAYEAIDAAIRRSAERGDSPVAEVVRYFWRDRINGSLLRGNDRRDLHDVVRIEEPDTDANNPLSGSTEKFVVQNTRLERDIIARTLFSGDFAREHRWALRQILDYEFRLREDGRARAGGAGDSAHGGGLLLPSGVGAAMIAATDVAADLPTGTFIGKALSPEEFDAPFVVTSIFSRSEGEYFDFSWPMPDWDSFRDFHIFSQAWTRMLTSLPSSPGGHPLDHLVYPFIALVASVAYDRHGNGSGFNSSLHTAIGSWYPPPAARGTGADLRKWPRRPHEGEWNQLRDFILDHLVRLNASHRRDQDFRHWFHNRLLLLAAPESGLSAEVANELYGRLLGVWTEKSRSEEAFRQTAIGARMARAKRVRIGGGKETGVPISVSYAKSTDTRVVNLIHQIDVTLGRHGVPGGFHYPPAPRRTSRSQSGAVAQGPPASGSAAEAVAAQGSQAPLPSAEGALPARGGMEGLIMRREDAPGPAARTEPSGGAPPPVAPEDEPNEDAAALGPSGSPPASGRGRRRRRTGSRPEAAPAASWWDVPDDEVPAASPDDDEPDDDPPAASASAGAVG